ncbi:16S rRNA (guanine(966)-N(2))-methyltransferase RsmD [Wenzhouxiangella sediminis]|uniref:Ribosomal RNA small subunit methyltransferase D n=1 Tax=Wenzhouxiangella sediminis TaxID=1792836 RepID=A0A3E1KEC4_9GAMM|nr:16S rRNA (guanine(966)-N(2))-methyltransferase RsmD [Wenzhouxiangella sediminis]RFF33127.1 16S rRNA (guanine(966)-N(2))-methyltransferase RsmD [Wenzhouxiangella sediminis]
MSGRIRIIGGQWRGRKLAVPYAPGLRPTGDRARETLFNWLQAQVPGARCLDLFAGTGALGLEALSRGAASSVFVERDRRLAGRLREIAGDWPGGDRMEVVQGDVLRWLGTDERSFDLVFIDPPFSDSLQGRVLEALVDGGHLASGARVYVEQDARDPEIDPGERYELLRSKTLGEVRLTLLAVS